MKNIYLMVIVLVLFIFPIYCGIEEFNNAMSNRLSVKLLGFIIGTLAGFGAELFGIGIPVALFFFFREVLKKKG